VAIPRKTDEDEMKSRLRSANASGMDIYSNVYMMIFVAETI